MFLDVLGFSHFAFGVPTLANSQREPAGDELKEIFQAIPQKSRLVVVDWLKRKKCRKARLKFTFYHQIERFPIKTVTNQFRLNCMAKPLRHVSR
jgi:hypothetical protein